MGALGQRWPHCYFRKITLSAKPVPESQLKPMAVGKGRRGFAAEVSQQQKQFVQEWEEKQNVRSNFLMGAIVLIVSATENTYRMQVPWSAYLYLPRFARSSLMPGGMGIRGHEIRALWRPLYPHKGIQESLCTQDKRNPLLLYTAFVLIWNLQPLEPWRTHLYNLGYPSRKQLHCEHVYHAFPNIEDLLSSKINGQSAINNGKERQNRILATLGCQVVIA